MKYNYSDELKAVFKALSCVSKFKRYANVADDALDPKHVPVLQKAYLTALRCDLVSLYCALDAWMNAAAPMEKETNNENN